MNDEAKIYKKFPKLWLLGEGVWEQISHESISRYIDQKQSNYHFKKLMAVMSRWTRLTAGVPCIS